MADEPEQDSKTEEASERKIQDALEKGNTPFSREMVTFASLLAILAALAFLSTSAASHIVMVLVRPFENPGRWPFEVETDATMLLSEVIGGVFTALLPALILLLVIGVTASLMQNKPRLVLKRIKPDASRLSIAKGWKRIFGIQGLVEFGKATFKFAAISLIGAIVIESIRSEITNALLIHPAGLLVSVQSVSITLVSSLAVAAAALALADLAWSRVHWRRQLRMTREELKNEHKQAEGDPILRARMRSIARDRSRRRMMAQVPLATLVLANPTHFAVALRYEPERDAAPVVLAKGQDLLALKIREIAEANGVPVVEDKPLARSLYENVQIDQMIPPEFYRAVAEIVLFLMARPAGAHARQVTGRA